MNAENRKPMPLVIYDLSRREYDEIDRMNWSRLKVLGRSPAHFLHQLTAEEEEQSDALVVGDALHVSVFEPESFARRFAIWNGGRRFGKEWETFCDANKSRSILTTQQAEQVRTIAKAVRSDATAQKYVTGGRGEVTIQWSQTLPAFAGMPETRIDCKARIDFIANAGALVDLKSTKDASPDAFGRQAWTLGYFAQCAWYRDGYEAATGQRLPFKLVAVEKNEPFVVQVYNVPDAVLDLGREHYRNLLQRYVLCRSESRWPGYAADGGELELTLPKRALPFDDEEDLTGMDLVFGEE